MLSFQNCAVSAHEVTGRASEEMCRLFLSDVPLGGPWQSCQGLPGIFSTQHRGPLFHMAVCSAFRGSISQGILSGSVYTLALSQYFYTSEHV